MSVLTASEILKARDDRAFEQEKLLAKYKANLISVTMNIPGDIKTNPDISMAFARAFFGLIEILKFNGLRLDHVAFSNEITGPVGYVCTDGDPWDVKQLLIRYEESVSIGRILDLDLIGKDYGPISRRDLGLDPRSCFICQRPANVCRREGRHTKAELSDYVHSTIETYNTWKQ